MFGPMRCGAQTMRAEVGHNHPPPRLGDARGMAEIDPVHPRIGEQAVEQNDWAPRPGFVPGESDTIGSGPAVL
jgi:hypothetical protein